VSHELHDDLWPKPEKRSFRLKPPPQPTAAAEAAEVLLAAAGIATAIALAMQAAEKPPNHL